MGWLITVAGLFVAVLALWDISHTLWHPGGFGRLARWVFQLVWRATKHVLPGHARQLAGPIGALGTVTLWTGLVVIGSTLIYLPHMPQGF